MRDHRRRGEREKTEEEEKTDGETVLQQIVQLQFNYHLCSTKFWEKVATTHGILWNKHTRGNKQTNGQTNERTK